jgi:hypothetical protein
VLARWLQRQGQRSTATVAVPLLHRMLLQRYGSDMHILLFYY